jgi:uncharacterized protein YodC (DUF2158 family)
MNFKVGGTVRLKSGGHLMTVVEVLPSSVKCQWFDEKGKLQSGSFLPAALQADDGTVASF